MSSKHNEGREDKHREDKARVQTSPLPEAGPGPAQAPAPGESGAEPVSQTRAEAGASPGSEPTDKDLRDKIAFLEAAEAALKEEVSALKDQYLRKLADDDNYRKRMRRETEDARKFANSALLEDLVSVMDDFDRAIGSSEHSRDFTVLHDGVSLIKRQLSQMLANKYGLTVFEPKGEIFDPNIHEALASEPGDVEEATVAEAFLPGYRLHDRVIRTAKVKVLTPRPTASGGGAGDTAEAQASPEGAGPGAGDAKQ